MLITPRYKICIFVIITFVAIFCGPSVWLSHPTTVHASIIKAGNLPIRQQVGYAGQVNQTVTGQFPVTFRLYSGNEKLVYEETIIADIHQGRFQVFVGSSQGDLRSVLKDSQQMKVFFEGNLLDSLLVIHTNQDDLRSNMKQYLNLHAVIFTDEASQPAATPQALIGTCSIVQSGFFTIPFTNVTASTITPSCGSNFTISGGYFFLTTPSQGVIVSGLLPVASTNWQVNYQVAATPATLQMYAVCCP